jgi:hypothetical protein
MLQIFNSTLIHAAIWYKLHAMCKKIMFPVDLALQKFGGVGQLAAALGYDYQRVHNWIARGVPAREVAVRPDIFAAAQKVGAAETAQERQVA